jgi:regulator of sigma E protease
MSLVLAILALGMLIVVHEAGHYFVARWCGMRVERFSIGFGPGLIKWRSKGTQFQIAPIPFGGFVQITGMNPHEDFDEKDPSVYPNRPTILRFLTIFAGPFTNVLFSSVLIFVVFAGAGAETGRSQIAVVAPGAAAEGHLQPGDVIAAVDGDAVPHPTLASRIQKSEGRPLDLTVVREGREVSVKVAARQTEGEAWRLGVQLTTESRRPVGLGTAAWESAKYPIVKAEQILTGLWGVVTGQVEADLIGPVGMTTHIRDQIDAGWIRGFEFLALLNVYLGLFNLLPLPALDGGRLAFLAYELATRRRPNPKVEAAIHMVGFVFLLVVMVLVLFKDIRRVVVGG